ncbi:hypothetical protein C7R93_14195 [Brevibacillus fortis]|uniref:Uncharacterized protein n=1 Tax=Brevibacillus fortis TaxID=2126352 RepID=A0A2P7V7H4_9BACL|nr:hypothetical protein C7R93_14195 [Brevibacillus fortis]
MKPFHISVDGVYTKFLTDPDYLSITKLIKSVRINLTLKNTLFKVFLFTPTQLRMKQAVKPKQTYPHNTRMIFL